MFYTLEDVSPVYETRGQMLMDVTWSPSWYPLGEVPPEFERSRILCTRNGMALVAWPKETFTPDTLVQKHGALINPQQSAYIAEQVRMYTNPWSTEQKIHLNRRFSELVRRSPTRGSVIYLDAEECATTKALQDIERHKVFVNDSSRVIESSVRTLKPSGVRSTTFYLGKMSTYLSKVATPNSIASFWGDYCSSFYNTQYTPRNDIVLLRDRLMPSARAAFTFSLRAGRRPHAAQIDEIVTFIQATLNATCEHRVVYGAHMFYTEFVCHPRQGQRKY